MVPHFHNRLFVRYSIATAIFVCCAQLFCRPQKLLLLEGLHWKKKWSHFDLKSRVTCGSKILPGIPSNWRMFESNWLDIESQIDSILIVKLTIWLSILSQFDWNILKLLGITGRILVPPVTKLFWSKWLHFFFQWWQDCDDPLLLAFSAFFGGPSSRTL